MQLPKFENLNESQNSDIINEIVKLDNFSEMSMIDLDLQDPRTLDRYIKNIERIARRSTEYRRYIKYLKENMDMTQCTFMPGIDINDIRGVKLEMHHYPLTLYDMTSIIVNHNIAMGQTGYSPEMSPFKMAHMVMESHYKNEVGLVPLSITAHKMAHNGSLFIPLNVVFGNYVSFLNEYHLGVSDELKDSLRTLIELTHRLGDNYVPEKLEMNVTQLEVENQSSLEMFEEVIKKEA